MSKIKSQEWIESLMLGEADPKEEIMLFPFGEFSHPRYGKMTFDVQFFNEVIDNYKNNVLGIQPFIDQEHDTGKALAWFDEQPYVRQGVGLFIKPKWTQLGKQLLGDKIYKYFSPWFEDFKSPVDGKVYKNVLRGGAATNIPFLKTMPAIIDDTKLSEKSVSISLHEIIENVHGATDDKSKAQTSTAKATDEETAQRLHDKGANKILLGGVYMTLDEAQKENEKILAESKKISDENAALKVQLAEANAKIESSKKLSDEVVSLKQKIVGIEAEAVMLKALSEGRIQPKDKEYWTKRLCETFDRTKEDIEHLPVSVKLGEVGMEGEGAEEGGDPAKMLDEKVRAYADEKSVSYSAAYDVIARKEKDLVAKVAATQYSRRR